MADQPPNLESAFLAALEISSPEERATYLDQACGANRELRAQIDQMLAAQGKIDSFLERPPSEFEATIIGRSPGDLAAAMEAGLAPTFGTDEAVVLGNAGHSVLKMLAQTLDNVPRVALRDSVGEGADPIVRPKSAEMPKYDSDSRYRLDGEIARGGMGAILKGRDTDLGRDLAIKVLLDQHKDRPEVVQRFVEEAQIGGQLQHPGIAPIYELGQFADKRPFFAMKLVKGETLSKLLADRKEAAAERGKFIGIFEQICQTMAYAHSRGVIHRDLKPANIMVGAFGEVQVMDWGLAKVLPAGGVADEKTAHDRQQGQSIIQTLRTKVGSDVPGAVGNLGAFGSHTQMGSVMGTPAYMPPEQALGEIDHLDERADVFGLGAILCEILTGKPPYVGDDGTEVYLMASRGKLEDCFQRLDACGADAELIALTKHCLELELQNRPRDAGMLAERVTGYLESVETKLRETERAKFDAQVRAEELRRRQKLAYSAGAAIAASLLIGMGVSLWQMWRAEREKLRATDAEQKAIVQADRATKAEQVAINESVNATKAEQKAIAQAERATKAEAIAVREKETARQALAKSQLDLAEKEFERGKFVEAQKILGETPESFRDANWRFLRAHSRDFTAQLSLTGAKMVSRLQFLPQGDRFAARCYNGAIGIFNLTGRKLGDWIVLNNEYPGTFGIDSTGTTIAFPASPNEVAVQDVATGKLVRRWTCKIGEIKHVLLSPDGGTVLAADGNQLIAYATETGAPLWTQPWIDIVPAFSPDGRTVAVLATKTGLDLKIQLLDTLTGAVRSTLVATVDNPNKTTLQFNQVGDRLACLGGDEVILWDAGTGRKVRALHFPGENVVLLSPGGDAVATISGSRIRLWDMNSGRLLRSLNGADNPVRALAFSPDGKLLLTSHTTSTSGLLYVWPTRLGETIASVRLVTSLGRCVVFDRDASCFYAAALRDAGAWETRSGSPRWKYTTAFGDIRELSVHPIDGSIVLSEFNKPAFAHLSPAGEELEAFGTSASSSLKFNRGGQLLLAVGGAFNQSGAGTDFSVMEYPSGNVLRKIPLENPRQPFAAFCLDDAAVATAARAGGIIVWDWKAGTPLRQIAAAQTASIGCLAASPDGRHLASGGPDRWIRVWEAATGRLEAAFRAHWEGVRCVKFSPDGREILSGSDDGTVRIYDAVTGEERLAFYGLNTPVVDVDISADGKLIAAITTDGYTKVWDRKISNAAALLPKKPKPALPKDADGWEDLLAPLTPAEVEQTGRGWTLKDGELYSPDTRWATLPLPAEVSGTSYTVRVKLRQLTTKDVFHVVLPIADRMCGFDLEGRPPGRICTGLFLVNGKGIKDAPGVVEGKQIHDTEPHELEVTVRLDGANATITTTLDTRPLYEWTGPTAALSQMKNWATTEPGALALGTYAGGWAVSEVKVKRVDGGTESKTNQP